MRNAPLAPLRDSTLAAVLVDVTWLYIRLGLVGAAEAALRESQLLYERVEIEPPPGQGTDPLLGLGVLALIRGDYAQAARLGEAAYHNSEARRHVGNLPIAWYVLTCAAAAQGRYTAAWHYARQAYATVQLAQDRLFMSACLNELGNVACLLHKHHEARHYFQSSYALRAEFNHRHGMADSLLALGKVALLEADYVEARSLFEQSLAIYQDIGDRGCMATALHGLGQTACAVGDYEVARQHLARALELATEVQFVSLLLHLLTSASELLVRVGKAALLPDVLVFVVRHPASDQATSDQAQHLLLQCESELAPQRFEAALQQGQTSDLERLVARLRQELSIPFEVRSTGAPLDDNPLTLPELRLDEPLTERELEVLHHIASGESNQEIAQQLVLSVGTVKWYVSQIFGKLQVRSRTQAIARARALHLPFE